MSLSRIACLLTLLTSLETAFSAVDEWFFLKEITYRQTEDNTAPVEASIWRIEVAVVTDSESDATSVSLSGGNGGPVALQYDDGEWYYGENFDDRAAMDARFPDGTNYTLTISGGNLGTVTQSFSPGPANYPNIPYLTGRDLSTSLNILPGQGTTLHWNRPNAATDLVFLEIDDPIADRELLSIDLQGAPLPLSEAVPANVFTPGWGYTGLLSFLGSETISGLNGFGTDGTIEYSSSLAFECHQLMTGNAAAIVGAWQFGDPSADDSGVIVFQPNGTYFHIEDVTPGDGRSDGIEVGTYSLAVNGTLTVNIVADTNGDVGLSDPDGIDQITIENGILTVTDDGESSPLTRVNFVPGNPLVGGWRLIDNSGGNTAVLVFLENGYYFHGELNNADPNGTTGMERGTYSVTNGILTATPITDTNGEFGLSDPLIGFDDLTITDNVAMKLFDGEPFYLHRVSNAAINPEWRVNKGRGFTQTAADTAPTTTDFWNLFALLDTRNDMDAGAVTLTGSTLAGPLEFDDEGEGEWTYDVDFATENLLDAQFPDQGDFTIIVSGGELGTRLQTINLGSANYPPIPYLNDLVFDDIQSYPFSEGFVVTWNDPTGSSTQFIISSEPNENGEEYFDALSLQGSTTSATVPADSLPAGATLYGYLEFGRVSVADPGTTGFGVAGFSARNSTTQDFTFITLGSSSPELNNAFANAGLSGEDSLPKAAPFNDGVDNLLKYAFNMNLAGPDNRTLEAGGSSGLPTFTSGNNGGQTTFDLNFVRRTGSTLTYVPQRSDTLGNFVTMNGSVTVTPIPGTDFERVRVSEPCDPAVIPRCFGRVMVALP